MTALPRGWAETTLSEACKDISYGFTTSATSQQGCPKFLRITDVQDYSVDWASVPYCQDEPPDKFNLASGDIVIARTGATTGKSYLISEVPERTVFASYLIRVRADACIDPLFLSRFMQSPAYWAQITTVSKGTAQPGANASILGALEIPLPPLPEQRRIVRKLDTLSARSTTARTLLTAIEKLVERMKGAVLSQALNGRLVASQLDCGEPTELSEFITGIEQGWSPKCDNEPERDPTKWAVLTTTAVQAIDFDCTENKRLPQDLSPRPNLEVEVGDVLMTRAGPRVRCAVCCYVAETAPRRIFSDKVYRIHLDQSVEPEFFVMVMNAPEMVRALDVIKSGGSESGLNLTQDRLKSLEISLWERPTQVEVVAEIKRQFVKIDRLAAEAAKAQKLLGHLDKRILAKAFAGDLVPQDPTDEPAEALLERIREARAGAGKSARGRRKATA